MIEPLVRFSLSQRVMLLLAALALAAAGLWSFQTLPIDAFPDVSSPQVRIIVKAPGMAPEEVESRITFPIETEMQGLPKQTVMRSTTKYALSSIILDFSEGTDIYWARQQVSERLSQLWSSLPAGVEGGLAPITTPLGSIYMYRIVGKDYSNRELRSLQDWVIRPHLRAVPGIADINSLGGEVRSFRVTPDPARLTEYGLVLDDLKTALMNNNRNSGGDRVTMDASNFLIRSIGKLNNAEDIGNITLALRNGRPVHIRDVASVKIGSLTRYGAVSADGEGEVVTGLALLRRGANSRTAVEGIKSALASLQHTLPPGVTIVPFYDRSTLVNEAVWTVQKALGEAVVLVLVVLLIMLGNLRSALTVALILPLSVLFTFVMMRLFGISANLMTLGGLAIAIGILVDAAVVVVENIHTRLSQAGPRADRLHITYRATLEVATPVLAGILIIVVVFLPLFSLTGLEGKMFKPLAITIAFALIGSLLLSMTVIPVLASIIMRSHGGKEGEGHEEDGLLIRLLKRLYLPMMEGVLNHRWIALFLALSALGAAGWLFPQIGKEFMPTMDEGTTVVTLEKASDISLSDSLEMDKKIQKAMMSLPEVTGVVSRTGADELRMDPMGLYQTDNFLQTRPRSEWTRTLPEFKKALAEKLSEFKGIDYAFTQPIDMRVSEMLTGVRAAMAIKLYGDDLHKLDSLSDEIVKLLGTIKGAEGIFRGRLTGQNYLQIDIKSSEIARYGINVQDINRVIEEGVAGRVVTTVIENNRRTGVLLRLPEDVRNSPEALGNLLIQTPSRTKVPLRLLADIHKTQGPVEITRESARRQVVIQANVKGRDIVGFVEEVKAAMARDIKLPQGYYVTFGGQFENQQHAAARLAMVIPLSIVLIFLMLFSTFRSVRQAAVILLNIPFAMIGGIISLYISGLYMSVPASVGFITLFGVAVLNGVVMVSYFNQLREAGNSVLESVRKGAERRLRPVLMTAMIASLGLLPLLTSTGAGSELQKPLAVVVIGGLVTSTLLTLLLLPMLYGWIEGRAEQRLRAKGETSV
ncbi:efflux RND transporter permease subunit [Mariprofundus ferrooxydans]|uniref:efflux RND transporter permease subunit n=1 Tax=Mariprofundus ferrooxydans TaxID=314344 RepID=UPI001430EA2E|nr:CusA/CzcA family heavy metal efflux RND transporter [Mariprofundus ferrooxydans]